jgi:hypothetical protein
VFVQPVLLTAPITILTLPHWQEHYKPTFFLFNVNFFFQSKRVMLPDLVIL